MNSKFLTLPACASFLLLLGTTLCFPQSGEDKQQELADHIQKAQTYLREKQPALAIPELQTAAALDPGNVDVQGNLGVLLFFEQKYADAIPHLRAAVDNQPGLGKIQGLLGIAEERTLDFEDARKDLDAAIPLIPDKKFKVEAGLDLVGLYTNTNDLVAAAGVLAQLKKADPDNPEVLYAAYRTYSDLTIDSMLSLSLAAPDSAQMHQLLAHEETKRGDTNGAIAEYRKAIAINPLLPGVHYELAELLNTSQDPNAKKEAEQEYRTALKQNPQDENAERSLGEIDARKGNIAEAYKAFFKAVQLQPADPDAKLDLAKILTEMNQPDKALPLLEQTVELDPTIAVAHYRLSQLYRRQGRIEDSKREVDLYKKYTEMKDKLRASYKELQVQPNEIRLDENDEK
jgi:tetratricopeptide (TPR) repeat protein